MYSYLPTNIHTFIHNIYTDTYIQIRIGGGYYDRMFTAAIDCLPDVISITSYNEWGEGTQIEPSVPKNITHTALGNDTHIR